MLTPEEIAAADAAKKIETENAAKSAKELSDLKASNADLMAKLAKLEKPNPEDDPTLKDKVIKDREAAAAKAGETKELESALKFNMTSSEFLKTNASLLPSDVPDIFKIAEKENYSSAIEKANTLKAEMIQSFFSVQENMDLLTPGLKTSLDDYLKLTKTGKQGKANVIFEGIFEPAFEMLKRIKKAEVLSRGHGNEDDEGAAYKNKMMKLSRQVHLGERDK